VKQTKLLASIAILALIVAASMLVYRNKPQTATTYEDMGGWVYECSRPIYVKDQGVKYGSGKPSLTPINQSDAEKYCHRIGIE
jgi:hypothetical protein